MKGRAAALLGVLLLSIFGIFVVYQSTSADGNKVKFVPSKSVNFDFATSDGGAAKLSQQTSSRSRTKEDFHLDSPHKSSQTTRKKLINRNSKQFAAQKNIVEFDQDYVADAKGEEDTREIDESSEVVSPVDRNQREDEEVGLSRDKNDRPLLVDNSEKERQLQEDHERRKALLIKQREEEQRKLDQEEKEQQLKEKKEAQLRQEAERQGDNQAATGDTQWNGLDPRTVHQKYAGIEFFEHYKLRPFVDLSDANAAGMQGKPADINDMTDSEAEERFYQLVVMNHVHCEPDRRMGNSGDGGWNVCITAPYKPKPGCLVYSFGINNDWSFDDTISSMYGCEVKAFDPSMHVNDHAHSDKVYFYRLGLFGKNFVNEQNWKMKTFGTILSDLGHSNRIIDYLKIDIEYSEWASFEAMIREGSLRNVRQFGFEIHTPELNRKKTNKFEFEKMYNILLELEKLGFRRWYNHFNHFGTYTSQRTGTTRTCCYEMTYININFLK